MLSGWQKNLGLRVVMRGAIAFFLCALILTLHRYYSFYADFDQGIFNQVFWNGIHDRWFESSLSSSLSTNVVHDGEAPQVFYHRLGQHFTPALLLWLPLYALFPSPATLSVLQVTLLTAAGLVLYVLARVHLQPSTAAKIAISYYAANAVIGPTLANFHDNCQLPLFVFGLLLAMEKRWWWLFWILTILILGIREDSGVVLFGVGFYLIVSRRYPQIGLAVCTLSFGYMLLLTNLIMPLFSEDISRRFMMERFGQYATGNEASTLEIIWGMLSNPFRLVVELFSPFFRTVKYLAGQWLPLGFVPAVSGSAWAIASFPLLKLFLGQGDSVLSINIRYALTVVPGLFYGAILWWKKQQNPARRGFEREGTDEERPLLNPLPKFQLFWAVCIAFSLFFTVTSSPNRTLYFLIPDSIQPRVYVSLTRQWQHVKSLRPLLAKIPDDASVSATTYIVPHLSGRREILRFPIHLLLENDAGKIVNVDYAIADLWRLNKYQEAFKRDRRTLQTAIAVIDNMLASKTYGILDFRDGIILLKKEVESDNKNLAAWLAFRQEVAIEND